MSVLPNKARAECTSQEELFCQLVVLKNVVAREAAVQAGWAASTMKSRGPKFLLDRPRIKKRIVALREDVLAKHGGSLEDVFLGVKNHVGEAIEVLADLMHNAESDAVKGRAAMAILDAGKGFILAAMPKRVTFDVLMSELHAEGERRLGSGEVIDITLKGETDDEPAKKKKKRKPKQKSN